jgi:A/G-specific adenine glycosylase
MDKMGIITTRKIKHFHAKLHKWYAKHGRRDLPWRNTRDAYAIYLSEIMLQQTQVKTVLERFYHPFLERFPTLKDLACASHKDVLSQWQGLGYYSRAGNLHKTAQASKGVLPDTVDELLALPGIGKNTAHAVASFAFNVPVPVMEANVKRVICRIFAIKQPTDAELWARADQLMDKKHPFDYNQAMMDIGAMVCTKRAPDCPHCPANSICKGQAAPEKYPAQKVKKVVPIRKKSITVLTDAKGNYAASPRETRFLGGLYHFEESEGKGAGEKIGEIEQSYSHFTLQADIYVDKAQSKSNRHFYSFHELKALPMSMAEKKILRLLQNHGYT